MVSPSVLLCSTVSTCDFGSLKAWPCLDTHFLITELLDKPLRAMTPILKELHPAPSLMLPHFLSLSIIWRVCVPSLTLKTWPFPWLMMFPPLFSLFWCFQWVSRRRVEEKLLYLLSSLELLLSGKINYTFLYFFINIISLFLKRKILK